MNGRERLRNTLRARLGDTVLVGEAMGCHGVTEGLPEGPNLLRTPLSENAAVGLATGLALGGKKVVVELLDAAGLSRAADALADLATMHTRSRGAWSAPVVIRAPWSESTSVPAGITVCAAATAEDLVGLLGHALAGRDPVVILEGACAHVDDADVGEAAPIGRAVVRKAGVGCTVFASADALPVALAGAGGAEVVDLRGGLDAATIGDRVRRTGRAVVVGADAALLVALREAFLSLESPLVAVPVAGGADAVARAVADAVSY